MKPKFSPKTTPMAQEIKTPHCLIFPFGLQGHVNPMLQFSKRLKSKGIQKITIVLTVAFFKSVKDFPADYFAVETISDGFDDGPPPDATPEEIFKRAFEVGSESLTRLLEKLRDSGSGADCLIFDPFNQWALDVAKRFGLITAMFFTQSNYVNSIYLNAFKGELKLPVTGPEIRIPGGLPVMKVEDMPSFIREYDTDRRRSVFMIQQFKDIETVDWVFVNTFYELEQEVCDWMAKSLASKTIGPTIPSMYIDKRIPDDKDYGLSAFEPVTDPCINWLAQRPPKSVLYVSFGSFAKPGAQQFQELASALKTLSMNFLWVVRASEESKLPPNYRDETQEKGLIVTWCHQLEVLANESIGCFLTHCGWNSTLEALSAGVPLVAVPQWSDQSTNARLVEDVWKVGVRAKQDENGMVREEEIVCCVKRVTDGESGKEMRTNAEKWRKLAREAVDEGGSSDKNIVDFASALVNRAT